MTIDIQNVIKQATVAEPCPAKWSDMIGDDKVRLCAQCNLNVHNTLMMTDEEVLQLVLDAASGKRVCGKLYKRADGTLLTQNCPVGVARLHQRVKQAASRAATWLAGMLAVLVSSAVQAAPAGKPCEQQGKKPVLHGTVHGETNTSASGTVTSKPPATATPVGKPIEVFDGQMVAPPTAQMVTAAKKSLSDIESKFGKQSAEAAYEHQRLGVLLETAYPLEEANLAAAETEFERAYQIQKARGDQQKAKDVARVRLSTGMVKDAAVLLRWKARGR